MNSEQLTSLLRTVLQMAGTFIVARGWADADTVTSIGGAFLTLAVTAWGLYTRRNAGIVASAAALDGVKAIATTPKLANAVESDKVQAGV